MPAVRRRRGGAASPPPPSEEKATKAAAAARFDRDFHEKADERAFQLAVARRLGAWRILFLLLMTYEWCIMLRHEVYDLGTPATGSRAGLDRVFAYAPLRWVQDTMPTTPAGVAINRGLGLGLGLAAAGGLGFDLTGPAFALAFARQFFATSSAFNNHDYLFFLLLVLTAFSGAGDALSADAVIRARVRLPLPADRHDRRLCGLSALRAQLSVLYLFAALWKLHPDWFSGAIVEGIFLSFEEQGVARGVPWAAIQEWRPTVFPELAAVGWALDVGMFASIGLRVPTPKGLRFAILLHLGFHGFTCFAMSPRIGYSFPLACLLAEVLYVPLPGDVRLPRRFAALPRRKAGRPPWRGLAYAWVAFQLLFPLRMPLIAARTGTHYARSARAYRFSWTMMLHAKSSMLVLEKDKAALTLGYLAPSCAAVPGAQIPRKAYMPGTEHPLQDPRTLPLYQMLGIRMSAMLETYPRCAGVLAARLATVVETTANPCQKKFGDRRVAIRHTLFVSANNNYVFSRLADPTVDLVAAGNAMNARSAAAAWWGSALDAAPAGHEWLLAGAGARLYDTGDAALMAQKVRRDHDIPDEHSIAFLVDRVACLAASPVYLKLPTPKLPILLVAVAIDRPRAVGAAKACHDVDAHCDDPIMLEQGDALVLTKPHLELAAVTRDGGAGACADAAEDVVFAISWDPRPRSAVDINSDVPNRAKWAPRAPMAPTSADSPPMEVPPGPGKCLFGCP